MFDISYFRSNPQPFYTLAHELYPGKYRPTISHYFVRLLSDKGYLLKLFTQNIDCLDREAGVPAEKIVEAHGSFATHHCIDCKAPFPEDLMRYAIDRAKAPHCLTPQCNGLVKPDIVFFGESLPDSFLRNRTLPSTADLCIVMGTSLSVQPFANLPNICSEGVPRVLINLERVGGLGCRPDDVLLLGDCDDGARKFATALGWQDELEALRKRDAPKEATVVTNQNRHLRNEGEEISEQVAALTDEVDKSLQFSREYEATVRAQVVEGDDRRTATEGDSSVRKRSLTPIASIVEPLSETTNRIGPAIKAPLSSVMPAAPSSAQTSAPVGKDPKHDQGQALDTDIMIPSSLKTT